MNRGRNRRLGGDSSSRSSTARRARAVDGGERRVRRGRSVGGAAGGSAAPALVHARFRHPRVRADGSGTFDVAWMIERGVAPFRLRLRPINSSAEDPETVMIDGNDREGRQQFNCADAARQADSGDWETAVGYRLKDYTYPPAAAGIRSARSAQPAGGAEVGAAGSSGSKSNILGQRYGEMPAPGLVDQSVHAEAREVVVGRRRGSSSRAAMGGAHAGVCPRTLGRTRYALRQLADGLVVRGRFGAGHPLRICLRRYFDGGNEWSETGVVTTLGEVTGIAASEEGDAVVVEWDVQPDAWMYAVRLRGQGRSWWTLHDATEGESRAGGVRRRRGARALRRGGGHPAQGRGWGGRVHVPALPRPALGH